MQVLCCKIKLKQIQNIDQMTKGVQLLHRYNLKKKFKAAGIKA
jgi:hypothetical protein